MKLLNVLGSFLVITYATAGFAAEPLCYNGKFRVSLGGGAGAFYSFSVKTEASGQIKFLSEVTNPNDTFVYQDKEELVSKYFSGDDTVLTQVDGVRCPCAVLRNDDGQIQITIEELGGGQITSRVDYYGHRTNQIEVTRCETPAAK